ncbi:ATP-binding protein [bacterium]|nr:ATP-binding protein [bacterium]
MDRKAFQELKKWKNSKKRKPLILQGARQENMKKSINYWTSRSNVAEIDFIFQKDNDVIPIEVKSTTNLKAKSLTQYRKDFNPKYAVRTSLAPYKTDNSLYNIPLYMVETLENLPF